MATVTDAEIRIRAAVRNAHPIRIEMPDGRALLTSIGVVRTLCDEAFGRRVIPPDEPLAAPVPPPSPESEAAVARLNQWATSQRSPYFDLALADDSCSLTVEGDVRTVLTSLSAKDAALSAIRQAVLEGCGMISNDLGSDVASLVRVLRQTQAEASEKDAALSEMRQERDEKQAVLDQFHKQIDDDAAWRGRYRSTICAEFGINIPLPLTEGKFYEAIRSALRAARQAQGPCQNCCDHKFVDSKHCLKCGWLPAPPRGEE